MKLTTSLDDLPAKSSGKQLLNVGIVGFGTVGSSVARILTETLRPVYAFPPFTTAM